MLHVVFDLAGTTPVSGEAANITAVLYDPDVVESEIEVTFEEIDTTGFYNVSFTPDEAGNWLLVVTNPAGTDEAVTNFVVACGAIATAVLEADAYCSVDDVVARVGYLTEFTSGTRPTLTQTLNFMARRAAILYGDVRMILGDTAPGPSNFNVTFEDGSDRDTALERVLILYNSIGTAIDVLEAAGAGETPGRSERIADLYEMWMKREVDIKTVTEGYSSSASRTRTHISVGDVSEVSSSTRDEDGLTFRGDTTW